VPEVACVCAAVGTDVVAEAAFDVADDPVNVLSTEPAAVTV
jgi:hypothetical protein